MNTDKPACGPYRDSIDQWLLRTRRAHDLVGGLDSTPAPPQSAAGRDRLGEIATALAHLLQADSGVTSAAGSGGDDRRDARPPRAAAYRETPHADELPMTSRRPRRATD